MAVVLVGRKLDVVDMHGQNGLTGRRIDDPARDWYAPGQLEHCLDRAEALGVGHQEVVANVRPALLRSGADVVRTGLGEPDESKSSRRVGDVVDLGPARRLDAVDLDAGQGRARALQANDPGDRPGGPGDDLERRALERGGRRAADRHAVHHVEAIRARSRMSLRLCGGRPGHRVDDDLLGGRAEQLQTNDPVAADAADFESSVAIGDAGIRIRNGRHRCFAMASGYRE